MLELETADTTAILAAARDGDQAAFGRLIEPYQRELLVHCYRILGSSEDAEDVLQETMLRAWRRLDQFAGRASLRAWLYKIATNASLDALTSSRRRVLPMEVAAPGQPGDPIPPPAEGIYWLEPLPDTLVDEHPASNPAARYEVRESVELAFLAALQRLPGRQRATLILRDVLDWKASEVALLLDTSVGAVTSALQRARATMRELHFDGEHATTAATSESQLAALLARYITAWENADIVALITLLREDAVLTMPPLPLWYSGRQAIGHFLQTHLFAGAAQGRFRAVITAANGGPAVAIYERAADGAYRPAALHVLTIVGGEIAALHDFLDLDNRLFARFALPPVL